MFSKFSIFSGCATLALVASLFCSPAFAQDEIVLSDSYIVEAGKPYPVVDGVKYYLRGSSGIICVKVRGKSWMIQTLSSETLTQKSRKEYTDMPEDLDLETIDYFGDRLFVFYSLWNKEGEREQLFYREIDPDAGIFMGKPVKMLSVNGKVSGSLAMSGFYRFKVTNKFSILMNDDENFMLVQYTKKRDKKDKDEPVKVQMVLFDGTLQQVWEGIEPDEYNDDVAYSTMDYMLDNTGSIVKITRVYTGTEEKAKDRDSKDYRYDLVRGGTQGVGYEATPVSLPNKYLLSMMLFEQEDGVLRAAGYYNGLDNKSTAADGVYTCAFDANDNVQNALFHEIPTALINMYVSKREAKKNDKNEDKGDEVGFRNMELRQIFTGDDGSLLLVGEKRYITTHCTTDSKGNTRCYDVYHADDLLVTGVDPNGELLWMKRISKRIQSRVPVGKSFSYLHSEDEHHLMHFDTHKNLTVPEDDIPVLKGIPVVMVDRINEQSGVVTREVVVNTEEVKGIKLFQLAQDRVVRTSDSELLMEAYKKDKEDILLRIQVKE